MFLCTVKKQKEKKKFVPSLLAVMDSANNKKTEEDLGARWSIRYAKKRLKMTLRSKTILVVLADHYFSYAEKSRLLPCQDAW